MSEPENMRGTRNTNTRPNTDTTSQPPTPNTPSNQNPNHTPSPSSTPSQPSLARRVQTSATGLARSAFTAQGDPSAAQTLAGATNGKAGAGASSTGPRYAASQEGLGSVSSGSGAGGTQGAREAFRETNEDTQGGFAIPALSEEAFQQEHGFGFDLGVADEGEGSARSSGSLQSDGGSWKGKQRARDPVQGEYTTAWERANARTTETETKAQTQPVEADGAAVVSLLSDTSFDAGFGVGNPEDPSASLELDFDPDAAPPPLTDEEIKFLDSFRRQVVGNDSSTQSAPAHLTTYSLVPDIDTFLQQNDPAGYVQAKGQSASGSAVSLRDEVLSNLPGAADWVGVHERYHDEVWGYLRPALEAARSEMEDASHESDDNDGPAVQRLKMILKHMKA